MSIEQISILQIKATLKFIKPPIWRRFTIPARSTLKELHDAIQVLFSWDDYHLREFTIAGKEYGLPDYEDFFETEALDDSKFELHQVIFKEGQKIKYFYDFGDGWEIDMLVEKVIKSSPREKHAICLDGKRNAPPEDVGGIGGYEGFLQAINDPDDELHDEKLMWIGGEFDPEAFDIQSINQSLKKLGKPVDFWEDESSPDAENHFGLKTTWTISGSRKFTKSLQELGLLKNVVQMLTYIQENKVVGTATTGNFPLKAVKSICELFIDPPETRWKILDESYQVRSEIEINSLYFYHVLASNAALITGGKGKKWRLTELGQHFLIQKPAWQYWHLLISWWTQTNWLSTAFVQMPDEEISQGFMILTLVACRALSTEHETSYETFVNNLAQSSSNIFQSFYLNEKMSIKKRVLQRVCVDTLIEFGILLPVYNEVTFGDYSFKELTTIQLSLLGASVLKAFNKSITQA